MTTSIQSTTLAPVTTTAVTVPVTGPVTTGATTAAATGGFFSNLFGFFGSNPTAATTAGTTTAGTTTAATTTAPVITTAAVTSTGVDPVGVALAALQKSAVDTLWGKTNCASYFFSYLGSIFSNSTDVAQAYIEDKEFGFVNTSTELVNAVAVRNLSEQESGNSVVFNDANNSDDAAAFKADAEAKTTKFYESFKKRITSLSINENSPEFAVYAAAAQKQIADQGTKCAANLRNGKTILSSASLISGVPSQAKLSRMAIVLPTKLENTKQAFSGRIFDDMVNAFASQPVESITIDSIKQKIALVRGFFSSIDTVDIEMKMRQAIKARHDTVAIDNLRAQFADPSATSARMQAIIAALSAGHLVEKAALEAELNAMRGPNGFDGTFNAAAGLVATTEAEMNAARTAYFVQAGQQVPANNLTNAELLALLTQPTSNAAVETAKNQYIEKARAFIAATAARDAIAARFAEIAQYTGANITGGRLFEINQNLDVTRLTAQARIQAAKTAGFYQELNLVVGENNKIVRSNALNAIFA